MQIINIHAAKTQLSRLAEQAAAGEEIIIAKAGRPVCRLMPLAKEQKAPRKLGLAIGEWEVPDSFDAPLPDDVIDEFYKNPIFPPGEASEPPNDKSGKQTQK